MGISGTLCVPFQQQQDNSSASWSVNHQSVVLSSVSHVLRGALTDCQSWYYQREQAADPAGSHRAAAASTQQRKSLSGKQLMSLTLTKVSRVNPDPGLPSRPSVCHRVPSHHPPHPTTPAHVLAALACRLTRFDDPVLLSEKRFQAGRARTALWWGPRPSPAPQTCGGGLWTCSRPSTRACWRWNTCFKRGRGREQ